MKALLPQRTSQQGEIELPPEATILKSESDFFRYFFLAALSCFVSCKVGDKVADLVALTFFCSNFVALFDAGGQSHNTVYILHRSGFDIWRHCETLVSKFETDT